MQDRRGTFADLLESGEGLREVIDGKTYSILNRLIGSGLVGGSRGDGRNG